MTSKNEEAPHKIISGNSLPSVGQVLTFPLAEGLGSKFSAIAIKGFTTAFSLVTVNVSTPSLQSGLPVLYTLYVPGAVTVIDCVVPITTPGLAVFSHL